MATQAEDGASEREETRIKKQILLETLEAAGGRATAACRSCNIPYSTFQYWKKKDAVFRKEVLRIRTAMPEMVEEALYTKAIQGDVSAAKYYLSNRHPAYKKEQKQKKDSRVDIHYHLDKKGEKGQEHTFEDLLDNPALYEMYEMLELKNKLAPEKAWPEVFKRLETMKKMLEEEDKNV